MGWGIGGGDGGGGEPPSSTSDDKLLVFRMGGGGGGGEGVAKAADIRCGRPFNNGEGAGRGDEMEDSILITSGW